jgi:hypothetical protein
MLVHSLAPVSAAAHRNSMPGSAHHKRRSSWSVEAMAALILVALRRTAKGRRMYLRLAAALGLTFGLLVASSSLAFAQGLPITPGTGNAGLAGSGATVLTVVLLIGAAVAVVVAARLWTTRGGGGGSS